MATNDREPSVFQQVCANRVTTATIFGSLVVGGYVASSGSLIVILSRDFGLGKEQFTPIASMFGFAILMVGLFGRLLIRSLGIVRMQLLSAFLGIVGYAGILIAPGYTLTIISTALAAFSAALVSLIVPYVYKGRQGVKAMAFSTGLSSLTSVIAPLVYGAVDKIPGVSGRFAILLNFVYIAPIVFIAMKELRARASGTVSIDEVAPTANHGQEKAATCDVDTIIEKHSETMPLVKLPGRIKAIFVSCLGRQAFSMFNEYIMYAWAATRLMEQGMTPASASMGAALFPMGMMVVRLTAAPLARRRGTMQICGLLVALGAIGMVASTHTIVVLISIFVCGLGVSLTYPISLSSITSVPHVDTATATSIASVNGGIAAIVGPLVVAAVGKQWGISAALSLMIVSSLIMAVLPSRLKNA